MLCILIKNLITRILTKIILFLVAAILLQSLYSCINSRVITATKNSIILVEILVIRFIIKIHKFKKN